MLSSHDRKMLNISQRHMFACLYIIMIIIRTVVGAVVKCRTVNPKVPSSNPDEFEEEVKKSIQEVPLNKPTLCLKSNIPELNRGPLTTLREQHRFFPRSLTYMLYDKQM